MNLAGRIGTDSLPKWVIYNIAEHKDRKHDARK